MLPAAPQLPGPDIPATQPANPFLDWLNLSDSDGGDVAHYRLLLEPKFFDILHRTVYSGAAETFYSIYLLGASYAAALMKLILDPDLWLNPLTDFYNGVTSRVYAVLPPTAIMVGTFAILLLSVFLVRSGPKPAGPPGRPATTAPSWLDQWLPSDTQIGKAQWQRLGSGLVMMAVVVVLAANPFKIIREIINGVLALSSTLSFTGGDADATTNYVTTTHNDMIRSVTFLVNYREFLDPACARLWSISINAGGANPACLTPAQSTAADPDLWTVLIAFATVFIAWGFLSFGIIVAIEFFKHLSLAVGYGIGATWVAALTLANRRPYDPLATAASRGAVHFILAIAVLFVSATGPTLFLQLVTSVLSFLPTLIQVLLAAAGYYLSGKLILFIMEKKTSLFSLFKSKVTASKTWLNLYPPNPPETVMSTMFGGAFDQPTTWAKHNYQQLRERTTNQWSKLKDTATAWGASQEGSASMTTPILPDTPEFTAATERIKLADKPTDTVIVSGLGNIVTAGHQGDHPAGTVAPVAVLGPTGALLPAVPAPIGSDPLPVADMPTVWFRGGIPQLAPPPDHAISALTTTAGQDTQPVAGGATEQAAATVPPAAPGTLQARRLDSARAEAAQLHGQTTPQLDQDDAIARTTALFRSYRSTPATPTESPRRTDLPGLRSVVSAAQWTQKFNHARNVLLARGVEAIPEIPADEEDIDRLVFAADTAGLIRIERKNDRGFGDWI
ncbi:hypothetical protein H7J86_32110 [Mycobacterium hackensackense]|uniref:hypothetical protein n=1 Tax=Mycobacterium hackensackense TaxID=228909 RepID=UPI002265DF47|nr:hypothetical protein [Mycobacterium hackensackense]MCV7256832.1 hypothetical protein [Mycobacterium hackensackense]